MGESRWGKLSRFFKKVWTKIFSRSEEPKAVEEQRLPESPVEAPEVLAIEAKPVETKIETATEAVEEVRVEEVKAEEVRVEETKIEEAIVAEVVSQALEEPAAIEMAPEEAFEEGLKEVVPEELEKAVETEKVLELVQEEQVPVETPLEAFTAAAEVSSEVILEQAQEEPAPVVAEQEPAQEQFMTNPTEFEKSKPSSELEQSLQGASHDPETPALETAAEDWKPEDWNQPVAATQAPEAAAEMAAPTENEPVLDASAAAEEWKPEAPVSEETEVSAAAPTEGADGWVTFVADPYGFNTVEVSDAQRSDDAEISDEELEMSEESSEESASEPVQAAASEESVSALDMDEEEDEIVAKSPEEVAAEMASLASAVAEEEKRNQEELEAQVAAQAVEAAETLAQQIAEDEALAAQLAKEEAEAEEIDPELQAALPQVQADGSLDVAEVESCIEALLFVTDKPISVEKLREHLGPEHSMSVFQEAVTKLRDRYKAVNHGIELVEVGGGLQFRTKPGRAALAKKLAKVQTQRLSTGAMESLAIVAYRQPVLKEEIDKIRGVDSSHFIRGLMDKKLIKISGRSELPGRPMLYSTTEQFLELFGLKDLSALPSLRELEQMVPASQAKGAEDEDPRVKEMRRLVAEMKSDNTRLSYDPREDEKILKEIREKVNQIPSSTPYLDEQKELERQAQLAAKAAAEAAAAAAGISNLIPDGPAEPESGSGAQRDLGL